MFSQNVSFLPSAAAVLQLNHGPLPSDEETTPELDRRRHCITIIYHRCPHRDSLCVSRTPNIDHQSSTTPHSNLCSVYKDEPVRFSLSLFVCALGLSLQWSAVLSPTALSPRRTRDECELRRYRVGRLYVAHHGSDVQIRCGPPLDATMGAAVHTIKVHSGSMMTL